MGRGRFTAVHGKWVSVVLIAGAFALSPSTGSAKLPSSWIVDVNPQAALKGVPLFGGRVNALAVNPGNPSDVLAASQYGGLYRSLDGGAQWSHVDALPMTELNDVAFVVGRGNIVVATGGYDGRVQSQGGIWISTNAGNSWSKPGGSDAACSSTPAAHGISSALNSAGKPVVFVGDECGLSISSDLGSSWTHLQPQPVGARQMDVVATLRSGRIQLDVCGDAGYFRSTNAGAPGSWSAPDPNTPYLLNGPTWSRNVSFQDHCRLALAPGDPDTVFLTGERTPLWESDQGGRAGSWVQLREPTLESRPGFVLTHPASGGSPNRFDVYYSDSDRVFRQSCRLAVVPRCVAESGWTLVDDQLPGRDNTDASDLAFDATGCPLLEAGDGGVYRTGDGCDASPTWVASSSGLDALLVAPGAVAGTVTSTATHLYFGTQDDGLFQSFDGGASWPSPNEGDVSIVLAHPAPPDHLAYIQANGFGQVAFNGLPAPPAGLAETLVSFRNSATAFGQHGYAFVTQQDDGVFHLWATVDDGQHWSQVGPAIPGDEVEFPVASGPESSPTFYVESFARTCCKLYRIHGPLDSSATLTEVDDGLQRFDLGVVAVDPKNPDLVYASDIGAHSMMRSRDGGDSWQPDPVLTAAVTHNGEFRYSSTQLQTLTVEQTPLELGQVRAIGFDPGSQTILVGTQTAGILASFDAGAHWQLVPGSMSVPRAAAFFFDDRTGAVYVGSTGRGLLRIDVPGREPHAMPTITSIAPASGPIGTKVTIAGTRTSEVSEVFFGAASADFALNSDGTITATVPHGAVTAPITLVSPWGFGRSSQSFTVIPPSITGFTPTSGQPGTIVTVTGVGLGSATQARVGTTGVATGAIAQPDGSITFVVHGTSTTGPITVFTPDGNAVSSQVFTVLPPPPLSITGFSPPSAAVGDTVTVAGANFLAFNSMVVSFSGCGVSVVPIDDSTISVNVPGCANSGPITLSAFNTVLGYGGTATSDESLTVLGAPSLTGFAPALGPAGTTIRITGSRLTNATVGFSGCDTPTPGFDGSDTGLSVYVPTCAAPGPLTVTNGYGSDVTTTDFTPVPGTITGVSPGTALVGSRVTISADFDLSPYRQVTFTGGGSATASPDGSGHITATVPYGAVSGPIALPSPDGHLPELVSSQSLTIPPPPVVTGLSPASGPVTGGTTVTITGSGFSTAFRVSIGDQANSVPFTIVDDHTITFVTPARGALGPGSFDVSVTSLNGTSQATPADVFTYL